MGRAKRFPDRTKATRLPSSGVGRLIDHLELDRQRDSAINPFHFEEWRMLVCRFDLDALDAPRDWIPVSNPRIPTWHKIQTNWLYFLGAN